jgi:hypothetical protein
VSLADLPTRIVDVECPIAVRCGEFPDQTTCRTALHPDIGQEQADVAAGTVKYDAAQAAACLDAINSALGSCENSGQTSNQALAACDAVFTGTVAAGGTCFRGYECASGHCDLTACASAGCCPGTCAAGGPTGVPLGGTCTGLATCAAGTFCDGITMLCMPLLPAGSPCTDDLSCAAGLVCLVSGTAPTAPQVCAAPPAEGAPCSIQDGYCALTTDFCDPATSTCKPRLAVGSDCDTTITDGCVNDAACMNVQVGVTGVLTSKCVALGRVGDPCLMMFGCLRGLECGTGGTCQVRAPDPICH